MDMITHLKTELSPKWDNRRKVIQATLIVCAFLLLGLLIGPMWLSLIGKFSFYIFTYTTTFMVSLLILVALVIGSYVFGARWENANFLNAIKEIVPTIKHTDTDDVTNPPEPLDGAKEEL